MPTATDVVGNYLGFAHHTLKERNTQFVAFMEAKVKEIEKRLRESGKIKADDTKRAPDAALATLEENLPVETHTATTTAAAHQPSPQSGDDLTALAGTLDRDPPHTPRPALPRKSPTSPPEEETEFTEAPELEPGTATKLAREAALTAATVQEQGQELLDPAEDPPDDEAPLLHKLVQQGLNLTQIAAQIGQSTAYVQQRLQQYGIDMPNPPKTTKLPRKKATAMER